MDTALDTDLARKLRSGSSKPIYLVEIQLNVPEGSTLDTSYYNIKMCSGDRPLRITTRDTDKIARAQYIIPNIVESISSIGQEVDAIDRSCTIANLSIVIANEGTIRNIMSDPGTGLSAASGGGSRHLYGQKVTVSLGVQDLDISKFLVVGRYVIEELMPTSTFLEIECRSMTSLLASFEVNRNCRARDPYAQMDFILRHTCALVDEQYDRTSVDPWWLNRTPYNDLDRRHLSLRRATEVIDSDYLSSDKGPNGINAWSLLREITYVTGGFTAVSNQGKISYVPWDPNKPADRDLTSDDITDFSQEVTYANAINKISHTISPNKMNITYDPYEGHQTTTGGAFAGPTQQAAYFGGNNSDAQLALENAESAREFSISDAASIPNSAYKERRWLELNADIPFESGMAFTPFLHAPTLTYYTDTDTVHSTYLGTASYVHNSRTVTLSSGKINITDTTKGGYVASGSGHVFRVVEGGSLAVSEKCAYKEGRIIAIDNSSGVSVITLADDQVLEFVQDFGHVIGMGWEILAPEYPVSGPLPNSIGLRFNMSGSAGNSSLYTRVKNCQRYFYVQYAAHSGTAA